MYPTRELNRLAGRKALLRQDIAYSRLRCAVAAGRVTRPLVWLDRVVAFWQQLPPIVRFAAVPLALLLKRRILPRPSRFRTLLRVAPLALAVLRGLASPAGLRPRRD